MRNVKEITVRTRFANTISGSNDLISRIESADVVKIVDMDTKVTLSRENPQDLLRHHKMNRANEGRIAIIVIPFTPGNNYSPPSPKPTIVLRKAKR